MYVKLKHSWAGNRPGDEVEAPDYLAERWIAEGSAVAIDKPKAEPKPEPEFVDPEKEEAKKPARKKRQARNDKSE